MSIENKKTKGGSLSGGVFSNNIKWRDIPFTDKPYSCSEFGDLRNESTGRILKGKKSGKIGKTKRKIHTIVDELLISGKKKQISRGQTVAVCFLKFDLKELQENFYVYRKNVSPDLRYHYSNLKIIPRKEAWKLSIKKNHKPNYNFAKVGKSDVIRIHQLRKKGMTLRALAEKFELSDMQIHRILKGENWPDVYQMVHKKKPEIKKGTPRKKNP